MNAKKRGLSVSLLRRRLITRVLLPLSVALLLYFHLSSLIFGQFPSYQSKAERDARSSRFPTVDERVKLYTSSWYSPPCHSEGKVSYQWYKNDDGEDEQQQQLSGNTLLRVTEFDTNNTAIKSRRILDIPSEIAFDRMFYYERWNLAACALRPLFLQTYCLDTQSTLVRAMEELGWNNNNNNRRKPPILLQFGDSGGISAFDSTKHSIVHDVRLPVIKKFRSVLSKEQLEQVTSGTCNDSPLPETLLPIVWKLETRRHFRGLSLVPRSDRNWKDKMNKAVFRGALTGIPRSSPPVTTSNMDDDVEKCLRLQRCNLVYTHAHSNLVDAKLTRLMGQVPEQINGVTVAEPVRNFRGLMSMNSLLQYKGIIILEGNDVSSGLKWVLLSQSVVLMPPPTQTSWAMEELLEPWVHYIPLHANLTDVEEKVQWMIDHDLEAQQISHRASLWIKDLVFHPDAESDEALIYQEILRRYKAYF